MTKTFLTTLVGALVLTEYVVLFSYLQKYF